MSKCSISTHILNLDSGRPATGVRVELYRSGADQPLATAKTNEDGRISDWGKDIELASGGYRLVFAVGSWFEQMGKGSFYSTIPIEFHVGRVDEHYHVPLLLNAYGYSTYRGS